MESVRKWGVTVAKLSKSEQSLFDKLKDKIEAPDTSPVGRSVRVNVDLSDPKQVALAIKHGFLDSDDDDDDDDDDKGDKDDKDDTPKRRGYFSEDDKKK